MSDPIVAHVFPMIGPFLKNVAEGLFIYWPTISIIGLGIAAMAYVFDWVDPEDDGSIYGIWIMISLMPPVLIFGIPILLIVGAGYILSHLRQLARRLHTRTTIRAHIQHIVSESDPFLIKANEEVDTLLKESSL